MILRDINVLARIFLYLAVTMLCPIPIIAGLAAIVIVTWRAERTSILE